MVKGWQRLQAQPRSAWLLFSVSYLPHFFHPLYYLVNYLGNSYTPSSLNQFLTYASYIESISVVIVLGSSPGPYCFYFSTRGVPVPDSSSSSSHYLSPLLGRWLYVWFPCEWYAHGWIYMCKGYPTICLVIEIRFFQEGQGKLYTIQASMYRGPWGMNMEGRD